MNDDFPQPGWPWSRKPRRYGIPTSSYLLRDVKKYLAV
jgi:hypothetical protein